ncbi:DUF481 domain-containing protein [Haliangium sp.]|uniref:DUF481 domain-containing protein n=1 Tax=Haliangium sp. TaxID=2663208 RepID=UPI003D0D12B1
MSQLTPGTVIRLAVIGLGVLSAVAAAPARAQNPSFNYADDSTKQALAEAREVEWKASAQAGLVVTTGNAETTAVSGVAKASRKANQNKLQLEAGLTYARATILVAVDQDGDGSNDTIDRNRTTTNNAWGGKARYDRFLTEHGSLYVTGSYLKDEPAGKDSVIGGQAGYSRLLVHGERAELVAEAGYDYSFEQPVVGDGVSIHSARVFVGYTGKLGADIGADASVEGLFNVNRLSDEVGAFEDTRVTGKLGLSAKVFEDISLRFGFEARFDNAPSTLTLGGVSYTADELDTKTEATVIVNFL